MIWWREGQLSSKLWPGDQEIGKKHFFLGLIEEGHDWREALTKTIKVIGINEYTEFAGNIESSNLLNQLKTEANITLKTLSKITQPLDIELTFRGKFSR